MMCLVSLYPIINAKEIVGMQFYYGRDSFSKEIKDGGP